MKEPMEARYRAKLWVNQKPVSMNRFVEEFLSYTMVGAVSALRGAEDMQKLAINQKKGNVKITVNNMEIPLTPFPNDIISNTLLGIVSSLKDVGDIDSVDIEVESI
jgi:hypothetical protein